MRALVRSVPSSYPACLRTDPVAIDLDAARVQHRGYVAALSRAGVAVTVMPPLDAMPDSVFVEDTVVMLDRLAVITRPGAPSRQDEGEDLATYLSAPDAPREILKMPAPATLDGGDVLRVGRFIFVGLSSRTNREGFEFLAAAATTRGLEAVAVNVAGGLHLKSACSRFGSSVIGHFDRLDRVPFESRNITLISAPDEMGANVLELDTHLIVSAAARKTAELAGERAIVVDVAEFHKGDGALTCLSVLIDH